MSKQVKRRRGTAAEIALFTPAEAEWVHNTTDNSIHVGDGVTVGGFKIPNVPLHLVKTTLELILSTGNVTTGLVKEVEGYTSTGDGGGAKWKATGNTITASQTPSQTGSATLSDANGKEFTLIIDQSGVINLKSLGSVSGSLSAGLANGNAVIIPSDITSLSLDADDVLPILKSLDRLTCSSDFTLSLPEGVLSTSTGDIGSIGQSGHNIKIIGATPVSANITSIDSVTGSAGDWNVAINTTDATGMTVGDILQIQDAQPYPNLSGDNSVFRDAPYSNELYMPTAVLGNATATTGSNSVSFSNVLGTLSNHISVGDLITIKGQTRTIDTVGASSITTSGAVWTNGVASSRGYWVSKVNSGTIGTGGAPSTTVTGVASLFSSEANIGDILLVDGQMRRIDGVASDLSLSVSHSITITNGTDYSILTNAVLHNGAHEITGILGNKVTVKNRSRSAIAPPVNKVTAGTLNCLKTVLKNTGSGNGFNFKNDASIALIDQLALQGSFSSSGSRGLALNGNLPDGHTKLGNVSSAICGIKFASVEWGNAAFLSHGCTLQARWATFSGSTNIGVYALEGAVVNLRKAAITGSASHGTLVGAGSTLLNTEGVYCGNAGDGINLLDGATVYGEIPFIVANNGMGIRANDNAGLHTNEGVSILNNGSGVRLEKGEMVCSRMLIACNKREGIETVEQSGYVADEVWLTGQDASTGSGRGILSVNSRGQCLNSGVTGNNGYGISADRFTDIDANGSYIQNNSSGVLSIDRSNIDITNGDVDKTIALDKAGNVFTDGVSPLPSVSGIIPAFNTSSHVHDFASIPAGEQATHDVTVTGAKTTSMTATVNGNSVLAGISLTASIPSADTVRITASNNSAGAIDIGNATYTVMVMGLN